jgi:hypothetical protein
MGCSSVSEGEPQKGQGNTTKEFVYVILDSINPLTLKLCNNINKKKYDEFNKIMEQNEKLSPLLHEKIKELCQKRDEAKPEVIATGNCCQNPCYEYNSKIIKNCPKCGGNVERSFENGCTTVSEWSQSEKKYVDVKNYDKNVCNKFEFKNIIDKIDYDLDEFFKYFEKHDEKDEYKYTVYNKKEEKGTEVPEDEYAKNTYMIVDGKKYDTPYGLSLSDYFRMNEDLFFPMEGGEGVSFFYEKNADRKELGQSLGYYGHAWLHMVYIYKCQACQHTYHILKTSPFRFRDKSKDNKISEA